MSSLRHRGPDDCGVERVAGWENWEIWFGHARLSILDLSEAARQPMVRGEPTSGESLVFNGEVYNYRDLRPPLESAHRFRTDSDTEVLLAGLAEHGPDFLRRTNGMLALGFWQPRTRTLLLARDRLGKKPLYIYREKNLLAFASELKALHALGLNLRCDEESWAYYRWLRHVPFTRSIYSNCQKLPAGSFAQLNLTSSNAIPPIRPTLFWDPLRSLGSPYRGSYSQAQEELGALLDDATRLRLRADVPVGVFLSSGIDSSLVASSVARVHSGSVGAYIVQDASGERDESPVAKNTARQLGLELNVLPLSGPDYERQVEDLAYYYDEPCSPFSQIPTMALAEAARRDVTVVLTGDGGDEVFLGYPWLSYPERLMRYRRRLLWAPGARPLAGRILKSRVGAEILSFAVRMLGYNPKNLDAKREIALDLVQTKRAAELYDHFQQLQPKALLSRDDQRALGPTGLLARAKEYYPDYSWEAAEQRSVRELIAALELVTSMRDEILVKVDRGTMRYSLEARSPLLDHRVVEFGLSLPLQYKSKDGVHKRILRDICRDRIGSELAQLPKQGFGLPIPQDLPPGPSDAARWAAAVEKSWRSRWGQRQESSVAVSV